MVTHAGVNESSMSSSPSSPDSGTPASSGPGAGHSEQVLRQFGIHFKSMPIFSQSISFHVSPESFAAVLEQAVLEMNSKPTCLRTEVAQNPFSIEH